MVAGALRSAEAAIFWRQATPDLAHAVAVARHVMAARPGRTDLVRAALLHDVGKIEAGLGTVGRSVASILHVLRLPLPRRMRRYADHTAIGARMLEDLAVEQAVSDFARHHRGARPDDFDPDDWDVLTEADHAS